MTERQDIAALRTHTPEQAAEILQVTASWLKEKARRREIPFSLLGGSYRFSAEHLAEIIRLFEQRPEDCERPSSKPRRRTAPVTASDSTTTILQARRPQQRRSS